MVRALPHPGIGMAMVLALTFLGVQLVVSTPLGLVDILFDKVLRLEPPNLATNALIIAMINIVAAGAAIGFGLYLNRMPFRDLCTAPRVSFRQVASVILTVSGTAMLCSDLDNLFRWVLPPPKVLQEAFEAIFFDASLLSQLWLLVVVAPVTEELLFRGIILRGLLSRHGAAPAILLSSLLFAVIHLNPWQIPHAFVLGLAFGWFYVRTGSIPLAILAHATANGLAVFFAHSPVDIPGLTDPPASDVVRFQPLWLDACGLFLLGLGVVLMPKASLVEEEAAAPPPLVPPVIAG